MPIKPIILLQNVFKKFPTWGFFTVFAAVNLILCYLPMSLWKQCVVLFVGIVLPLLLAFRQISYEKNKPHSPVTEEFLDPIPLWLWLFLIIGIFFTHFYKFDNLFMWPGADEGLFGLFGLQLSEKWNWTFFYTVAQHSPLLIWILSFTLRVFKSPLLGFWSIPTFLSIFSIFLNYFVLKYYFSKSFSFLGTLVWTFSLFSFMSSRFCSPAMFVLPWELLCFGIAAVFFKENRIYIKKIWIILLAFLTGLGYFTFPSWPIVAVIVVLILFVGNPRKSLIKNKDYMFLFFPFFFLALIPFLTAIWVAGYGEHIKAMSRFNHWFSSKQQWMDSISYFSSLFWGNWGSFSGKGHLLEQENPLLGACFFIGCTQIYQYRSNRVLLWIGLIFILCFFPGFFSGNLEIFRIIQIFPFLLLISTLGLAGLLIEIPRSRRITALLALILISVLIDGYRILQEQTDPLSSPAHIAQSSYPIESIRSYKILKALSETTGPGFIFTEFMQVPSDNCLLVMTYGFNAAENPNLNFRNVQWAAVVSNSHYYSFLSKRFPEARWYWVHEGHPQGIEEVLGIIPINKENFQILFSWVQAHHYFRQLSLAIDNISEEKTYKIADELLNQPPSFVTGDRFLESCYWERRAQFYYDYHFEVHYNDQVFALRQAIAKGYPSAHLYYELGCLLARKGSLEQARSNFKSALRIEPQYLPVIEALEYLNQKEIVKTRSK